jgi:ribosomal protein S18 acetylase RimI-like enzyme
MIRQDGSARVRIEPYGNGDRQTVQRFVAEIQDHERHLVPALRPGHAIADSYTAHLLHTVATRGGTMLMARVAADTVGFVCAWPGEDDDPLVEPFARTHGYVSELFVVPAWRRRGVGQTLLEAAEAAMAASGCTRLRICSKASNQAALGTYAAAGFSAYEVILDKLIAQAP